MSRLEGYACDGCGKRGEYSIFRTAPRHWYALYQDGLGNYAEHNFCTKHCLETWLLGEGVTPEVEPRKVLFMKWLKSLVR